MFNGENMEYVAKWTRKATVNIHHPYVAHHSIVTFSCRLRFSSSDHFPEAMTNLYVFCLSKPSNVFSLQPWITSCNNNRRLAHNATGTCRLSLLHSTSNRCSIQRAFLPTKEKRSVGVCYSTSDKRVSNETPGVHDRITDVHEKGNSADWIPSILLFGLWVALLYYVFLLSPNQTPYRDAYFLKKLLYLKGDDGFHMNQVLVCLWYIMGLWPVVYSMLLLPSGRSSNSRVPLWPFLILSCFGGAFALLPYFILWQPPAPTVDRAELGRWPLNFLESKITAVALGVGGLVLALSAGTAGAEGWKEFIQYVRESKFIHATSIDFFTLSALSPFWVYNDMTVRNWLNKGSWLLPLMLVPYLGPSLYLILRPSLPSTMITDEQDG